MPESSYSIRQFITRDNTVYAKPSKEFKLPRVVIEWIRLFCAVIRWKSSVLMVMNGTFFANVPRRVGNSSSIVPSSPSGLQ